MKVKSQIIGLQVVVTDSADATVYEVVDKHPNAPAYLLAYETPNGKVTKGWYDICYFKPAPIKQPAGQLMSR